MKERISREAKKRGMRKIAGIAFFLVGGIFLLSAFSIGSITGNTILDGVNEGMSLGFGFLLVIVGITLFVMRLERELEINSQNIQIIRTRRFDKSLKQHRSELKRIDAAIGKIGTGLADEEYLKHKKMWSIRTSKGGRVEYDRKPNQAIIQAYNPPSIHHG